MTGLWQRIEKVTLTGAMICLGAAARGGTVDYTGFGTFQTHAFEVDSLKVTGSSDVGVFTFNGLGVMGGIDFWLDGREYLDFNFMCGPALGVSYHVLAAGNLNPSLNSIVGESFLEAFDRNGFSLGVIPLDGTGEKDVSAFFGYAPISSFRVAANVDALRIDTVTFSPVPEPGALGLFACGLAGLLLFLRRR